MERMNEGAGSGNRATAVAAGRPGVCIRMCTGRGSGGGYGGYGSKGYGYGSCSYRPATYRGPVSRVQGCEAGLRK
jgi:hypothetical protein